MRSATFRTTSEVKFLLDEALSRAKGWAFIDEDPISIPHRFERFQDIEISGFIAALFAWGQRKTILEKSAEFIRRMDNKPLDFVLNHEEEDLRVFKGFVHRTFNEEDARALFRFLKAHYSHHDSLESAFFPVPGKNQGAFEGLVNFRARFVELGKPYRRSLKHVATPVSGSACKRLNMFLRWMIRKDSVDFGLWRSLSPSALICPYDVHVQRVATGLGLVKEGPRPWDNAVLLTRTLSEFDPLDPVKYDLALFSMGLELKKIGVTV